MLPCLAFLLLLLVPGCHAASWEFWNAYAASFINEQGRVIDHSAGDVTTSEGQSYALFFSIVANDRVRFDKVLQWTSENLAIGDLSNTLPAWKWGRAPDGQWKVLDPNSASDSDLWICYSLLEAGRLWHVPRYTALGRQMAARIAALEVADLPGLGPMLLPGPNGFHPNADTWILNPSYVPLPLLQRLAAEVPSGPWSRMVTLLPRLLEQSSRQGFAMDWITFNARSGFAPAPAPSRNGEPAMGSYDAIRVYLWAGLTDPASAASQGTLHAVSGMARYLDAHPIPPSQVSVDGAILNATSPVGFCGALLPYLSVQGKVSALQTQLNRIDSLQDPTTKLYGHSPTYYDQNLLLFGKGWQERRFRFSSAGQLKVKWDNA